jgi:DNA-binding response OmpR family regulator
MDRYKVLVVDDDIDILNLIHKYLERENINCEICSNSKKILEKIFSEKYDLLILDIMMPEIDGFELLKKIRQAGFLIPIIMLSARREEYDKVLGLGLGADDYVTKPFSPGELTARVKAHLRRGSFVESEKNENLIEKGIFKLNNKNYKFFKNNEEILLSSTEFQIMKFLFLNSDTVFSKNQLMEKIWGYEYEDSNIVNVYIKYLRDKIETNPKKPEFIQTIWGIGYRFTTGEEINETKK